MRRREFIGLLGSTAAWPITARAQLDRMRRVGVLMPYSKENPQAQARIAAFLRELQRLGWTTDHNLQIEYRWDTGEPNSNQKAAMELVALSPDVILATATPVMVALQQTTHTVPIVFVQVADPVSAGFITSLAKPGGNATGLDTIDPYRHAAGYVDRILKGEKPADLPVQGPTKYELAINLKTAKALDLTVANSLLSRATELIE